MRVQTGRSQLPIVVPLSLAVVLVAAANITDTSAAVLWTAAVVLLGLGAVAASRAGRDAPVVRHRILVATAVVVAAAVVACLVLAI